MRSKVMMPLFRLPFVYLFSFAWLDFWSYSPCNYDNYFYFPTMHMFSFDDKFCIVYVCLVCLPLSMQHSYWW